MIVVVQCIVRYAIFMIEDIEITLSTLGFVFLVLATVLITAGGYVINDVFDSTADRINKPTKRIVGLKLSEKQARLIYFLLTFTGLGLGFILTSLMGKPWYFLLFALSAILLYLYARYLRRYAIIGNIVVSILVALATLLVAIFELLPPIVEGNRDVQMGALSVFISISVFAFLLNFIRELVKDIEDIQGDHVAGFKTLPIILGAHRTARLSVIFTLATITIVSWYTFTFLYDYKIAVGALFFGVIAPLGYCSSKLWEASKKSELSRISLILKVVMLLGICMIPLFINAIYYA